MKIVAPVLLVVLYSVNLSAKDEPLEQVKRMAEAGNYGYIYELAVRYERGTGGVAQDFNQAIKWHCKNKPALKDATNGSMLKLEKIAESDPEVTDPTEAQAIYCDQKKPPKPSLEPFSPIRVSWCTGLHDSETVRDCFWFKGRFDQRGQRIGADEVAETALAELPPMGKSRDWFLHQAFLNGIYGASISSFTWGQYQNGFIAEDEKQRPYFTFEIETKYLKKTKTDFSYNELTDDGRMKLLLKVNNKELRDCFERGLKGRFKQTMILFNENAYYDKKFGRIVNVALLKDCYGSK